MTKVIVPLAIYKTTSESKFPFDCVRQTYVEKLLKYGLRPLFVSSEMPEEILLEYLSVCNGAFFFGGNDIDPALYEESPGEETKPIEKPRDLMEVFLLKKIIARKLPYLGICRGSQMLNIVQGGSLIQDIPSLGIPEKHMPDNKVYDSLGDEQPLVHQVLIDKKSKAHGIVKKDEITVNTGHHQAVKKLGNNLVASGKSPYGIVEIIEHTDKNYFCFGIQSHPEVYESSDLEKFFDRFAWACKH